VGVGGEGRMGTLVGVGIERVTVPVTGGGKGLGNSFFIL
jgi:hypothetical protein